VGSRNRQAYRTEVQTISWIEQDTAKKVSGPIWGGGRHSGYFNRWRNLRDSQSDDLVSLRPFSEQTFLQRSARGMKIRCAVAELDRWADESGKEFGECLLGGVPFVGGFVDQRYLIT
jgi:hypothetical protein